MRLLVNPDDTIVAPTTVTVTRALIEKLLLTLEPRSPTWKMDNESLLLNLQAQVSHHAPR